MAAWCSLALFLILAIVIIAIRIHVRTPAATSYLFDVSSNSLVHFEYYNQTSGATRIDLDSSRVEPISFDQSNLFTFPQASGNRLRLLNSSSDTSGRVNGYEVFDPLTRKSLVKRFPTLMPNEAKLVGDRFIVGIHFTNDQVFRIESIDTNLLDQENASHFLDIDPLPAGPWTLKSESLDGTSLFLVKLPAAATGKPSMSQDPQLVVYDVDQQGIREVTRWPIGGTPDYFVHDGKIYSLSVDGKQLEVRPLAALNDVQRMTLTPEMAMEWPMAYHRCGMVSILRSTTGREAFYRLSDLSPLNVPPGFQFATGMGTHYNRDRYPMLTRTSGELIVFDPDQNEVMYQRKVGRTAGLTMLGDKELGLCDLRSGITIERIDLTTGETIKLIRPYAWLNWLVPILACVALINCFVWIHAAHAAGINSGISFLALTITILGLSLFVTTWFGTSWDAFRPSVSYAFTSIAALVFASGWYAALGSRNWTLRWSGLVVAIAATLQICALLTTMDETTRALIPLAVALLITFPGLITAVLFTVLRLYGLRWERISQPEPVNTTDQSRIRLLDYFLLTAAVSFLLMSLSPLRSVSGAFRFPGYLHSPSSRLSLWSR